MENSKEAKNQIYAKFFTDELNRRYGFDYKSKIVDREDVDFCLESLSGYSRLNLQLKTIDAEAIRSGINNTKFARDPKSGKSSWIQYAPTVWVESIIKKSLYSTAHDLILLLHPNPDHFNPIFNSSDIEKEKLPENYFKGIYYVIPPIYKDEKGSISSMFIVIKDAFSGQNALAK